MRRRIDYDADDHPLGAEFLDASAGIDLDGVPEAATVHATLRRIPHGAPPHVRLGVEAATAGVLRDGGSRVAPGGLAAADAASQGERVRRAPANRRARPGRAGSRRATPGDPGAGPRHDRQPGQLDEPFRCVPVGQVEDGVGAEDEPERRPVLGPQRCQGVERVGGAGAAQLHIRAGESGLRRDGEARHRQAVGGGADAGVRLAPGVAGGDEEHARQPQLVHGRAGHREVHPVRRVEGAAEDAPARRRATPARPPRSTSPLRCARGRPAASRPGAAPRARRDGRASDRPPPSRPRRPCPSSR